MKGKIVHIELPADEPSRAKKFWSELAGWQYRTWDGPVEYHMFEGDPGGAIYPRQESESGPIVYFEADDIDATVQQIRALGGSADDKHPISGIGWYARCRDTEGNPFSLFQTDEAAAMPG